MKTNVLACPFGQGVNNPVHGLDMFPFLEAVDISYNSGVPFMRQPKHMLLQLTILMGILETNIWLAFNYFLIFLTAFLISLLFGAAPATTLNGFDVSAPGAARKVWLLGLGGAGVPPENAVGPPKLKLAVELFAEKLKGSDDDVALVAAALLFA